MIELPGGYAMDAYEFGYVVGTPYVRKKGGRTDLRNATYHSTPASAIENVLQRVIRDRVAGESITTLSELLEAMNEQRRELEAMLKPMERCGRPRESVESEETADMV